MEKSESQHASGKLEQLKVKFQVDIVSDWGPEKPDGSGDWKMGTWSFPELEKLDHALVLMANLMGGGDKFIRNIGGVAVRKADIGSHGGEALQHRVSLSAKHSISPWTVVHEFAHAWDANHGWKLSVALEKYTGGFTSPLLAWVRNLVGLSDSGFLKEENKPGRRGRKPGCNAAGYFYGDKPSGSNWKFNRVEDFAESVAMYIGWERENDLSQHARDRIVRYTLNDGEKDAFNVPDNWTVYRTYFYPEDGDYTKTKRWQFVDDLVKGKLKLDS